MADGNNSPEEKLLKNIPTNEEIVGELVDGVKKTVIQEDTDSVTDQDSSEDVDKEGCGESEGNEVVETSNLDDLVDEDELKNAEATLTDEEKESRKEEAQTHKAKGNEFFKIGSYLESADSYTLGLRLCPLKYPKDRSIMYANRAAAKVKLERFETALEDCTKAVELDAGYVKAWTRRAQVHEKLDKLDEALEDYKKVLLLDPSHQEAGEAVRRLPDQITERNEKLKEEMLGKLKDLGNMILRPFGLSTNNFQMTKDPNSGGYSVNFKSNPN